VSDGLRESHGREDLLEQRQAELAAEHQRDADIERNSELARRGVVATGVQERLAAVAAADAREQRRYEQRQAMGLPAPNGDYWGSGAPVVQDPAPPRPRLDRWELKRNVAERQAAAEVTSATVAEVSALAGKVQSLTSAFNLLKRRP
jgi:hypothetical protein